MAPVRDIETPSESLLTRSPSQLPKPARKAGFSTFESGCGRETDCLLEGDGFELSVPLAKERRFRPLITRNSLTTTPSAFQIGGNSIRSQGIT